MAPKYKEIIDRYGLPDRYYTMDSLHSSLYVLLFYDSKGMVIEGMVRNRKGYFYPDQMTCTIIFTTHDSNVFKMLAIRYLGMADMPIEQLNAMTRPWETARRLKLTHR